MVWLEEWKSLEERVQGLIASAEGLLRTLQVKAEDASGVIPRFLAPQGNAVLADLRAFFKTHGSSLPPMAAAALTKAEEWPGFDPNQNWNHTNLQRAIALRSLLTEFNFHIAVTVRPVVS
jgi:hypothetical protein